MHLIKTIKKTFISFNPIVFAKTLRPSLSLVLYAVSHFIPKRRKFVNPRKSIFSVVDEFKGKPV